MTPDHSHVKRGPPKSQATAQALGGRGLARALTRAMGVGVMTTLDGDTVEANIPSVFRGPVMITVGGCPEKAAARTRRR